MTVFVDSMMPVHKRMRDILPKKPVCDRIFQTYLDEWETIYRMIHIPTFTEQYNRFWDGNLESESFLPLLLVVLSTSARFDAKSKGLGHDRAESIHIPTACALVRTWLDGLRGKQLVELTTLEVEILLLHAQRMVTPRIEDTWTKLGFVVRLAMTMGLHRDPSEFEPRMSIFLGELRRRLWFTIVDMDLHVSMTSNLPSMVREDAYTTRPPRNLDDSDLFPEMTELPPSRPIDQPTDNQMQTYAAMTLPVRVRAAQLSNRTDSIADYREVLDVGSQLEHYLEDINYIFPRQGISQEHRSRIWRSRVTLDAHVRRPLLALYRPFALSAPDAPAQIPRSYLRSSMVMLGYLDELDPNMHYFRDISTMYHTVLKREVIMSAFAVCHYLQSAMYRGCAASGQAASPASAESHLDSSQAGSGTSMMVLSPARMLAAVQKTRDLLIANLSGWDTKDLVVLSVVLETVKGEPAQPQPCGRRPSRSEDIVSGLRGVLDACLHSAKLNMEELDATAAAVAASAAAASASGTKRFATGPYMSRSGLMMYQGEVQDPIGSPWADDSEGWNMWNGWDDGTV